MITEEDKYCSEIFKIGGFALMTPLGQVILSIPNFRLGSLNFPYIIFAVLSIMLFCFGIILLLKGLERAAERNKRI